MAIPLIIGIVAAAIAAACGKEEGSVPRANSRKDGGDKADGSDGNTSKKDGGDGGFIDIPLPIRENIQERRAKFLNCDLVDLKIAGRLFGLCSGITPRLMACPLSQNLDPVACEEFVKFPSEISPLVHHDVGSGFSVVTAETKPGHQASVFVIDRGAEKPEERIKDGIVIPKQFFPSGGSHADVHFSFPFGAILLGGYLLIAARSCVIRRNAPGGFEACTSHQGTILPFRWNGDGTFVKDLDLLNPVWTTHKGPTHFIGRESQSAWVLNNGWLQISSPASLDVVSLDEQRKPRIDSGQNHIVGNVTLEALPHLALNPDKSKAMLASDNNLLAVELASGNVVDQIALGEGGEKVVSTQWYSLGNQNTIFATVSANRVYSVALDGAYQFVANPEPKVVEVYGQQAGPSALDASACIFYQGIRLEGGHSAITAMRCNVLNP